MIRWLCGLLALCLCSFNLSAGVYRWVDENGRVQFGDRPPQTADVKEVKIKSTPKPTSSASDQKATTPASRLEKQQRLLDAFREEREAKQQKIRERDKKKAKKKQNCTYARDQLRVYKNSSSLYDLNSDGTRRTLSDEEYKKAIGNLKRDIQKYCN